MAGASNATFKGGGFKVAAFMLGQGSTSIGFTVISGSVSNGTSGTWANSPYGRPGSLLVGLTAKKLYINTNTNASPTWTVVGSQS